MHFKDRQEAGKRLAKALKKYRDKNVVVFALPRGGVILGAILAQRLESPLDLVISRKIGHPYSPEYAIAAVSENGDVIVSEEEIHHVDEAWFQQAVAEQITEAKRRRTVYLANRELINIKDKTCIIVDDGLATGLTMKAAIKDLRHRNPKQIIVAVPIAPQETVKELSHLADEVIALYVPAGFFGSIGGYYQIFDQISDEEVIRIMKTISKE